MGCSSSKTDELNTYNKKTNTEKTLFPKEKQVEAIFISQKIQKNGKEMTEKIIKINEKNENNLLLLKKDNSETKDNFILNKNDNQNAQVINCENVLILKINDKIEFSNNNNQNVFDNNLKSNENNSNNNNPISNNNLNENKNYLTFNPDSNKNLSSNNRSSKNYKNEKNLKFNNNSKEIITINSKNIRNNKALLDETKINQPKLSIKDEIEKDEALPKEIDKIIYSNNKNICINNKNLINKNFNEIVNDSVISKLSSNMIKSKTNNLKDTNIVKDENELILNLTKTQNLTHFQDDLQNKNILNSIDKEDNLLIKFNSGAVANSLLNNTNYKINESQSQQNISNFQNNPSMCEENKSDRFSFKFDLTSNFDLHSKFSKFDSTNNISRIKVPYYDNNNYEQNYTLTNMSNMNDLTNLNNNQNNQNNQNNLNNPNNPSNLNNNNINRNNNELKKSENQNNETLLKNKGLKDSQENIEEEEIQLSITLSVRASKFEAMYPIWIEKNKEVDFRVMGKWTIDSTFPMCDCNGYVIKNKENIKKDPINNNINNIFSNNQNLNTINNVSNITCSTNYYAASTNNTNLNINSKNLNTNKLVFVNSPIGNEEFPENASNKNIMYDPEKRLINGNNNIFLKLTSESNINVNNVEGNFNINIQNLNKNHNEINFATTLTQENSSNKKELIISRPESLNPSVFTDNNFNPKDSNFDNNKSNIPIIANFNSNVNILSKNNSNTNLSTKNNLNDNTNKTNFGLNCLLENYPNGCLIGRVLGGPYFRITSKCNFISEYSGPLFLKMNISDLRMNPEGKLSVFINGAEDMPFMSIEKKLGWDINSLSLGCNLLKTESERLIYTFINKIRINSNLFAQQYLENIKSLSNATNNLYLNLLENKKTFKLLNMDPKLLEYGKRLLKREIEKMYNVSNKNSNLVNLNNNNNNLNSNMNNNNNNNSNKNRQEILEQENKQVLEMEKNLNSCGYRNLKFFIKKHEDTKPLSVAIKYIIDEKAREQILSKDINSIGLLTVKLPQGQKGFYTCINFGNYINENETNKNVITEINRNVSEIMNTE